MGLCPPSLWENESVSVDLLKYWLTTSAFIVCSSVRSIGVKEKSFFSPFNSKRQSQEWNYKTRFFLCNSRWLLGDSRLIHLEMFCKYSCSEYFENFTKSLLVKPVFYKSCRPEACNFFLVKDFDMNIFFYDSQISWLKTAEIVNVLTV